MVVCFDQQPRNTTFCSAFEVPTVNTYSVDIDKARQSNNVILAEALVLSPSAEL